MSASDWAELRAAASHGLTLVAWRAAGCPKEAATPAQGTRTPAGPAARPWAPYRSKWEYEYAQYLDLERAAGLLDAWAYEPETLHLPGGTRYTYDFRVVRPWSRAAVSRIECHEVKGLWRRHERILMREIAAHYPDRRFVLVRRQDGKWVHSPIEGRRDG